MKPLFSEHMPLPMNSPSVKFMTTLQGQVVEQMLWFVRSLHLSFCASHFLCATTCSHQEDLHARVHKTDSQMLQQQEAQIFVRARSASR
jgi:hypothetical protein